MKQQKKSHIQFLQLWPATGKYNSTKYSREQSTYVKNPCLETNQQIEQKGTF